MLPCLSAAQLPDSITMHHDTKAALPVLANDAGNWQTSSVAVATAPTAGVATVLSDGRIRYQHTTGTPGSDSFSYRVTSLGGVTSAPVTVTITFSAQSRLPATTLAVPLQPPSTSYQVVDAFPGLTFSAPTSMESPPGETNRLFVTEKAGWVYLITNVSVAAPQKIAFLDISARVTNDSSELGLKGIAFHPGYETNGIFFLAYCSTQNTVRLSRFQRQAGNPNAADPDSEVMLINQTNNGIYHNIDDALFGPDGYLYVGMGDEGPPATNNPNTQIITQDLWSAILRIDPDKRPGNVEPNPHPAVPTNGAGQAFYSIPTNNPFLGATQFNGVAVQPGRVRTEFYAVGFRNPWQFSFDELTGELWVADVGDVSWEEVSIIPAGGNGGWYYMEGTHPLPGTPPPPAGFSFVPPVWEYSHEIGPYGGSAITGGFVVRGTNYPDLEGKYLCADVIAGNIWTVEKTALTTIVERIAGEGTLVQFGHHPADGGILMLDFDEGVIRRLVQSGGGSSYPSDLSSLGLYADLADLSPNPGVVGYEVNLPFWSDHAIKRRWFAVSNLTDVIGFSEEGPWGSPTGMVWAKHFDFDLDRGNPATRVRLETRVLVRTSNGAYGVSYRWNPAGTEATLVPDGGLSFDLAVTNAGVPLVQPWRIPSRAECMFCHQPEAGHALSFNMRQLNRTGELAGVSGNFLDRLAAAGYFAGPIGDPRVWPRHVRPDEESYSREVRARSYLAVNCGYCHRGPGSTVFGAWDGRAERTLAGCSIVGVPASDDGGDTNNLLVAPGSTPHSIIWNRVAATNGFTRMPPLGSAVLDPSGIQLLSNWIMQDLPGWQSYEQWRLVRFSSTNSPEGEPGADPDGDGRVNEEEFLTYTSPTNADDYETGSIALTGALVEVNHRLFNRSVLVETSADLQQWDPWLVDGNNGLPAASGVVVRLLAPGSASNAFYRFLLQAR
jgi:glucose/arabinose dehydrogenase